MSKKYLVFISSTQDDLKAERRELTRIVTEMGAIPVTMDAFDITLEEDRRVIRKAIGECDYFINVTAYKIGEKIEKSYALELEYAYAKKAGLPVLALIINEKARWKDAKKEKDSDAAMALEAFKKKLRAHSGDTWNTMGELKQKAIFLLNREMYINPRRGWVPSTEAVDGSVANELARLIRENEVYRSQIDLDGMDIFTKVRENIKHTLKVLAENNISLSFYYINGENWENTKTFRYLKLLRLLAPELSTPKTVMDISRFLGTILNPDLARDLRKDFPTPSNTVKKIMADFTLLKLVKFTGNAALPQETQGDNEAWEITEYGNEVFGAYRLRHLTPVNHPADTEATEQAAE